MKKILIMAMVMFVTMVAAKEGTKMKMTYKTNKQYRMMKRELIAKGYTLIADCYWYQIFERDNKTIELERE